MNQAKAGRAFLSLFVGHEPTEEEVRRELVNRIIKAVCLGFGIHRSYLLQGRGGGTQSKRNMARNTLAMLITDLVLTDDNKTIKGQVACQTMMSAAAMDYCLKRGRFMCKVDDTYRQKVAAIAQSVL